MKRSELLKSLIEYISNQEYYGHSVDAETILDMIEEAGMLPPPRSTGLDGVAGIIEGFTTNTWEPENE